jgi:aryl-alcohol dehydrogenase-like predicted oxidoreductase
MKTVVIPGTTLRCSKFIFGTAKLFAGRTTRQRIALLEAAVDNGFTHFDTAPYYGFGTSERDLSHILKRYPKVTVTTKVGIYSPGGEEQRDATILLRKLAGKLVPAISRPTVTFHLERARSALDNSLRRLGREQIDLYMLHEPQIHLLNTEEWQSWLEEARLAGKIAAFGVASMTEALVPFLREAKGLTGVVQTFDSLDGKEADVLLRAGRPLQVTYGYLSAAFSSGKRMPVDEILRLALERNPLGAIIVSTRRRARLSQYARLLETIR